MVLLGALIIGASIEMYEYEENYVLEFIKSMLEAREIDT